MSYINKNENLNAFESFFSDFNVLKNEIINWKIENDKLSEQKFYELTLQTKKEISNVIQEIFKDKLNEYITTVDELEKIFFDELRMKFDRFIDEQKSLADGKIETIIKDSIHNLQTAEEDFVNHIKKLVEEFEEKIALLSNQNKKFEDFAKKVDELYEKIKSFQLQFDTLNNYINHYLSNGIYSKEIIEKFSNYEFKVYEQSEKINIVTKSNEELNNKILQLEKEILKNNLLADILNNLPNYQKYIKTKNGKNNLIE